MDNYNLQRFIDAQQDTYPIALSEIKNGKKESHWIWYIFPQLKGHGHSHKSNYYGIETYEEATAYLQNKVLGTWLREISYALYHVSTHSSIQRIVGNVDSKKICSCMTMFDFISPKDIFDNVLHLYFNDERCQLTLVTMEKQKHLFDKKDGIIKSIIDFLNSPDWETKKNSFYNIIYDYYEMIRTGKMEFGNIPLCFEADAWCLLEDFAIEDEILIAMASDFRTGPPDYVGFYASELPISVLETAYNILKNK